MHIDGAKATNGQQNGPAVRATRFFWKSLESAAALC
jgi:hypothetical protein